MQSFERNVNVIRITIVVFSISKNAFYDLSQKVQLVCAILFQSVQAGLFDHQQ